MKKIKVQMLMMVAALSISMLAAAGALGATPPGDAQSRIAKQVRHELVTLPYYGVFDNLAYQVDGSSVTLYGQVVRPITRSDAAQRVARIAGVTHVVNNIQVLPLSSFDSSIRQRTYRAIARTAGLTRYLMGTNPSIHIVVGHGQVTLEGVVSNKGDRQLAYKAANQVPGVFSVKNNLRTDREVAN